MYWKRAIKRSIKLLSKLNKKLMANRFLVETEMNLEQRWPNWQDQRASAIQSSIKESYQVKKVEQHLSLICTIFMHNKIDESLEYDS